MGQSIPCSQKPFPQSFWVVDQLFCAGHYPGDLDPLIKDRKLHGLLEFGIQQVISLMEPDETGRHGRPFDPYLPRLEELAGEHRVCIKHIYMSIPDASVPTRAGMQEILDKIHELVTGNIPTYVHCWGGHGRTSTVVACYLMQQGLSPQNAIAQIEKWRSDLPKNHDPFTMKQAAFILEWPHQTQ